MEEIFEEYDKAVSPNYIGQDISSKTILAKSKALEPVEYDQVKQTKYYEVMRWTVNHLAMNFLQNSDFVSYFNLIREIKDIKNTNNTFLIKLTDKLISKIKKKSDLLKQIEEICNELITFCKNTNNISMKNRIETRLAEVYFIHGHYSQSLDLCNKIVFDLKRYEDNLGLIVLQLLESKIYYATKGISKAKASLTSVKTLITKVYVEPKLQANIDLHAGILAAHEKDFGLAFSYFYESFDAFNIPTNRKKAKALKAFQYMILCKLMGNHPEEVNAVILSKSGRDYICKEVEALQSIFEATKMKSLRMLKENFEKNKQYLNDPVILYHIGNLNEELLEKNLIKIILPYSVVEIDFITKSMGLTHDDVIAKLRQMILDKKINGILDQGKGCLNIYESSDKNPYFEKSLETFKNLEKVVEALDKKVRMTNI